MKKKNEYVGFTKTGKRQKEKTPGEKKNGPTKSYAQIIGTIKKQEKKQQPKTCLGAE